MVKASRQQAETVLVPWLSVWDSLGMSKCDALAEDIRGCQICADLPLGPRPLFKIDSRAKILIAGQAPGRRTHGKGIPFDDPSGERLRDWMGVDRDVFYDDPRIAILPMGLCYPGTGKSGDLPPRSECAPAWRLQAMRVMDKIDLTMVIGRYAIDWHMPDAKGVSITSLAQKWQDQWPDKLVLPHPSPRNNRWLKQNPWFQEDVVPALRNRVAEILIS